MLPIVLGPSFLCLLCLLACQVPHTHKVAKLCTGPQILHNNHDSKYQTYAASVHHFRT